MNSTGVVSGGVTFFDDVGWNGFHSPLSGIATGRAIFANLEAVWNTSLVVAARLVEKTEPTLYGRIHFCALTIRDAPSTDRERRHERRSEKNTERRQYAIERFIALRLGLTLIRESHENSPAINQATFPGKWNPISSSFPL